MLSFTDFLVNKDDREGRYRTDKKYTINKGVKMGMRRSGGERVIRDVQKEGEENGEGETGGK